jgi:hypothetical protein
MSATITVEARVVGRKQPLFTDWIVPLPEAGAAGRLPLRDVITRIVLEEVRDFQQRQAERRLARIMTKEQIERAAEAGKIDLHEKELKQEVDPQAAVETALQAFEDGLYYVFVDGAQIEALESEVAIQPDSRITFIRLVGLAGG